MSQHAIGKLVIAVTENHIKGTPIGKGVGDLITLGMSGTITDGPVVSSAYLVGLVNFWAVDWANGLKTWSAQPGLQVIGDRPASGELEQADVEPLEMEHA